MNLDAVWVDGKGRKIQVHTMSDKWLRNIVKRFRGSDRCKIKPILSELNRRKHKNKSSNMSKTKKAQAEKIRTVYGGKEAITQLLHNSLYGDVMEPIQEDYDRIWSEVETLFEEKETLVENLKEELGELTDDLQKMEQEKEEATDRVGELESEAEDLEWCVVVEVRGMEAREKLLNFIKTEIYPHDNDQHKYIKSE